MRGRPLYFEAVRQKAATRWNQLEADPDLAGPWHQLFKQVQSPRHVLSELLQNADDAGATEAAVWLDDEVLVFEHNGEDFTEEHFTSLCRFGFSNKRALHTIGFRGIGFKSIFSLGDSIDLYTPSLAVRFHRKRFTEPQWLPTAEDTKGKTRIRAGIADKHRHREVEKNLEEWLKSPVSLLFFRNIRRLQIGNREVRWVSLGPGPIADSEWMALHEKKSDAFLLIRSQAEPFPEEALAEIRQERMVGAREETDFPPCKVEIVLGLEGRLYVVLPTGVETQLPFACNAPFIQDPARLKIKDPEISPTNRWLLARAGKLAASGMLCWLNQANAPLTDRAPAYGLFPDVDREVGSLEGVCGIIAELAFAEVIKGKPLLLTEDAQVVCKEQSLIIPIEILEVWPAEQAAPLLDESGRPALCQHIRASDRDKLVNWGFVQAITKEKLLEILQHKHLPRPVTWRQLMKLWAYIAADITGYRYYATVGDLRIVPVQGKEVLYAAKEVVRLGEKKLLQSEADWEFLSAYLVVMNQNWPRFLAEQRRSVEQNVNFSREAVEAAYAVLKRIGLDDVSDANKVVDRVAQSFFSQKGIRIQDCVQLAQIAAKLGATVAASFRYVTRDKQLRPIANTILFDEDGKLEELLPEQTKDEHLLHPAYGKSFGSCSREDWLRSVASGRAGLATFVPLKPKLIDIHGRREIEAEARKRGIQGGLLYQYVTNWFNIEDWDYDELYWSYWKTLSTDDDRIWVKVVERILSQHEAYWTSAQSARFRQTATTGHMKSITQSCALPSWVLRLRELPCLRDRRGFQRKPTDLLRRTPETESLIEIEPFVDALLDCEATRPLLDLLGVKSTPIGPDRLLDRLRALSIAGNAPVDEVDKWYRRLDQMIETCSTADFQKIKEAFRTEHLTLARDGSWATSPAIFLSSDDEDVPGAAIVRSSVGDLSLWRKIGVAERPTAELAIAWLKGLPSNKVLPQDDARRVRALMVRYPVRIWEECRHWLNLVGEWTPIEKLSYALTMQSLVSWGHLHPWVKQETADFQRLSAELTGNLPFSKLSALATQIEDRLHQEPLLNARALKKSWLTTLGMELCRIELETDEETRRVRAFGEVLAVTSWQEVRALEIIPYIEGKPAGTPRQADVIWLDKTLYVTPLPSAKLARRVPEEIGKVFGRTDIKGALDYGFERSAAELMDYLAENFTIAAPNNVVGEDLVPHHGAVPDGTGVQVTSEKGAETGPPPPAPGAEATDDAVPIVETDVSTNGQGPLTENPVVLGGQGVSPRPQAKPRPTEPSLIELFALKNGFQKDGANRFFHADGSWISRSFESPFPWERHDARGQLLRCYLPISKCLQQEPLELEFDVWALLERRREMYALILLSPDGSPVEMTGDFLCTLRDKREITLHPARYRIVDERGLDHKASHDERRADDAGNREQKSAQHAKV